MPSTTRRRGRGESSIYKRPDGYWTAVVSLGFDAEGKRIRKFAYARSKAAVQAKLEKLRGENGAATDIETVAELFERWLADVEAKRTATTLRWYKGVVDADILPVLGRRRLADIGPLDIQNLYKRVAARGAGDRTQQRVHVTLRAALKAAMRWGVIDKNPADAIDAPSWKRPSIRPLSTEDLRSFLNAIAGDRYEALYLLAVFTGMREGELFGLRWADVDLARGVVHVQAILSDESGKPEIVERTKTRGSRRAVAVPAIALAALRGHRKKTAIGDELPASMLVFTSPDGKELRRSNFLRREFHPLIERAKLPRMRFHDLRHSLATLLFGKNVHPKVVQEMLGHARVSTTLDVYSHLIPTMQAEAVAAIDELFPAIVGRQSVEPEPATKKPRRKP